MFYLLLSAIITLAIPAVLIYSIYQNRKGQPNRLLPFSLSNTPEGFGISLGFKLGFALSITYAVLGIFIVQTFVDHSPASFFTVWAIGSPLIFLGGILPAVVCGMLTGLCLAKVISKLKQVFTSILIGVCLCAIITAFTHYIFDIQVVLSFEDLSTGYSAGIYGTYPFYIGMPSIIYIFSGGWASWYMARRFLSKQE